MTQKTYELALIAVARIEADLGVNHYRRVPLRFYRNGSGQLLHTLDQVITTFLADDLWINGENVCGSAQPPFGEHFERLAA